MRNLKNIKNGTEEIKVTGRIYGSYSIMNNKLVIYKGCRSNIYYLTYDNMSIMMGSSATALLKSFDDYISKIDGLDNKLRFIRNMINNQ